MHKDYLIMTDVAPNSILFIHPTNIMYMTNTTPFFNPLIGSYGKQCKLTIWCYVSCKFQFYDDTNSTMMINQRMTNIMPILDIKISNTGFITNQPINTIVTPNSTMIVIQSMTPNVLILVL